MINLKRHILTLLAAGLLVAGFTTTVAQAQETDSQTLTVDQIVQKTNEASYYKGEDGRARVSMAITDSQGRERTREFTILRRDEPSPKGDAAEDSYTGEQKFYVYFHRPADVSKMVFMVWKHLGRDDDRWLYLPALDLVKRIAATDKRTSFVGSDFFYEDVSGRNIDADVHELTNTTDTYYILKNTPRDPSSVEFDHYIMYIHRGTFLPVQIEYYDSNGEKYRVYRAEKVETIQGYPTVMQSSMQSLRAGSKTTMTYSNVEYDVGLPEDIFTERYLRRPPMKYLR